MNDESCKTCKFWKFNRNFQGEFGHCYANPPVVRQLELTVLNNLVTHHEENTMRGVWPVTFGGDWCGAFKAKDGI